MYKNCIQILRSISCVQRASTRVLLLGLFFVFPVFVYATEYTFVEYMNYEDAMTLPIPTDNVYYGELDNFPHNYFLTLTSESQIYIAVHDLDGEAAKPDKSVMFVTQNIRGPVTEVARLNAQKYDWVTKRDALSREVYKEGPSYGTTLQPGNYLIEVSSPDNEGRYALIVRKDADTHSFNLIHEYVRIAALKRFLGKPLFSVLLSPLYYVPVVFGIAGLFYMYWRRKKSASDSMG